MGSVDNADLVVAVLDDDRRVGSMITKFLEQHGFRTRTYDKPENCLANQKKNPVDIIITDLRMPCIDGIEVLKAVKEITPDTDVIMVTGNADKNVAIQALRLGAFDFFEKPVNADELIETVKRTVRYQTLLRERNRYADQVSQMSRREAGRWGIEGFVGQAPAVLKLIEDVRLLQKATDIPVLVTGESGTGKELVARAIHAQSERSGRPFVPVNCSALPHDLAESLLFGHMKGSFTGATADRIGCFEQADGGTLFLDEIGDMPPLVQVKLLRVLEDGNITPVGASRARHVSVRVIAATNADLHNKTAKGDFREDLYFRLSGFVLHLPSLRERRDDIPLLAEHFANRIATEMGLSQVQMDETVIAALKAYVYPGNVRELKNIIERALIVSGGTITTEHLHFLNIKRRPASENGATKVSGEVVLAEAEGSTMADGEKLMIERALRESGGNVAKAARRLNINRTKLYRKMAALGIEH